MQETRDIDFCVLIPCYNNLSGLINSLGSIHYSTDRFLVLVVDDGSDLPVTDTIIRSRLEREVPLFVLSSSPNQGITAALNKGLDWISKGTIRTRYIARLDCGDRCTPDRFTLQVNYMNDHPQTGLLGSWCRFEDRDKGTGYLYKTPLTHSRIMRAMYFRNVFIHPTVLFRTELIQKAGYYPEGFDHAEDYALFWKFLRISTGSILENVFVITELNKSGISYRNRTKQLIMRARVITKYAPHSLLLIAGLLRVGVLLLIPQQLILWLKKTKG